MCNKLTSRQIQAKNTKDKIYNIAIQLIKKEGFDNVTVAEICEKADVSVGSFYNYFKSKYDILNEIFKLADDYFYDEVRNSVEGNALDKTKAYLEIYAKYNEERGIDFTKQLYSGKNNLFTTKRRPMQLGLDEIIKEGQKNGEINNELDSYEIVDFLFISIRGVIYDWCLFDGEYDLVDRVNTYVELLLKSIVI